MGIISGQSTKPSTHFTNVVKRIPVNKTVSYNWDLHSTGLFANTTSNPHWAVDGDSSKINLVDNGIERFIQLSPGGDASLQWTGLGTDDSDFQDVRVAMTFSFDQYATNWGTFRVMTRCSTFLSSTNRCDATCWINTSGRLFGIIYNGSTVTTTPHVLTLGAKYVLENITNGVNITANLYSENKESLLYTQSYGGAVSQVGGIILGLGTAGTLTGTAIEYNIYDVEVEKL